MVSIQRLIKQRKKASRVQWFSQIANSAISNHTGTCRIVRASRNKDDRRLMTSGGQVPLKFDNVSTSLTHVRAGQLRALPFLAMLAAASPAFALTGTKHAKGRVIAINRRTHVMTVRTSVGKVRLKFNSTRTRLWHNGTRISLSRLDDRSGAFSFLNVDSAPTPEILEAVRRLPHVRSVQALHL